MQSAWYPGDRVVTQGWGCTPVTFEPWVPASVCSTQHFHRGIDVMMPIGTPLSVPPGLTGVRLQAIGYDPYGFGPAYPLLMLPSGRQALFGHTVSVVGGPRLLQSGEVFAYSGNEGLSTGPHTHAQVNASPGDFVDTVDPVANLLQLAAAPAPTPTIWRTGKMWDKAQRPDGRIDLFYRGRGDGHLWHKWSPNGHDFSSAECLGGAIAPDGGVLAWNTYDAGGNPALLVIEVVGTDHHPWRLQWDWVHGGWSDWGQEGSDSIGVAA